jgi:hypothetical protein
MRARAISPGLYAVKHQPGPCDWSACAAAAVFSTSRKDTSSGCCNHISYRRYRCNVFHTPADARTDCQSMNIKAGAQKLCHQFFNSGLQNPWLGRLPCRNQGQQRVSWDADQRLIQCSTFATGSRDSSYSTLSCMPSIRSRLRKPTSASSTSTRWWLDTKRYGQTCCNARFAYASLARSNHPRFAHISFLSHGISSLPGTTGVSSDRSHLIIHPPADEFACGQRTHSAGISVGDERDHGNFCRPQTAPASQTSHCFPDPA